MFQRLARFQDHSIALLRIIAGFMFMLHGAQKLFGLFGGFMGTEGATAPLVSLMGFAGVLEFFGGLAVMIGLFTQPVAFILSGQMAVAYFMVHVPKSFWPLQNGGEHGALYSLIFLLLATHRAGKFSVDQCFSKKVEGS